MFKVSLRSFSAFLIFDWISHLSYIATSYGYMVVRYKLNLVLSGN